MVWCGNRARSHESLSSVALLEEFTWCDEDDVMLGHTAPYPALADRLQGIDSCFVLESIRVVVVCCFARIVHLV